MPPFIFKKVRFEMLAFKYKQITNSMQMGRKWGKC